MGESEESLKQGAKAQRYKGTKFKRSEVRRQKPGDGIQTAVFKPSLDSSNP